MSFPPSERFSSSPENTTFNYNTINWRTSGPLKRHSPEKTHTHTHVFAKNTHTRITHTTENFQLKNPEIDSALPGNRSADLNFKRSIISGRDFRNNHLFEYRRCEFANSTFEIGFYCGFDWAPICVKYIYEFRRVLILFDFRIAFLKSGESNIEWKEWDKYWVVP